MTFASGEGRAPRARASFLKMRDVQAMVAVATGQAKYLFIHIPKNAGVALARTPELRWKMVRANRHFLRDRAYVDGLLRAMGEAGEHHGIAHARLRDIKPGIARRLRPVAVLRNPWSRTVSRYLFAQHAADEGLQYTSARKMSFEAFLETRHEDGERPYFWHRAVRGWYPQLDYVVDANGQIAADLLRQEYLGDEAKTYFELADPPRRRNVTKSGKADWRALYTEKTIGIVADWYARDIEAFGFDFDTPATKNVWALRDVASG